MKTCSSNAFRSLWPILALGLLAGVVQTALAQTTVILEGQAYPLMDGPIGLLDGPCDSGAWSSTTEYHSLQAVSSGGSWYRAIAQSGPLSGGAGPPGTNSAKWVLSVVNLTGSV